MTTCKAICKNNKSCSFKAKKNDYCLKHYKTQTCSTECSVCLCNIDGPNIILSCNHIFHEKCITSWLSGGNFTCPVCRTGVSEEILKSININFVNKYLRDAELKLFSETYEDEEIPDRLLKCYAIISGLLIHEFSLRKNIIEYLKKRIKNSEQYIKQLHDEINVIQLTRNNLIKILPTKSNLSNNCGEQLNNIMITINALLNWGNLF